jgi:Flp pilus assembly protein TadD
MRYYPRLPTMTFMRPLALTLLACVALAVHSLHAQSTDPGDLFVSAYMAVQAGEKAEQGGNVKEATSKFRYAAQILDQISERYPSWQPSIIDYRKKRTAEAITRMQEKGGQIGGGKGEPAPAVAPPSNARNPLPGLPDDILPPTPTRDVRKGTAPRTPVEPPDLPASTPAKETEQRLEKMQRELERMRAEAARAAKENQELAAQLAQANAAREAADKKQSTLAQRSATAEAALARAREAGQTDSEDTKQLAAELAGVKKQLRDLKFEADADAEYRQQIADRVRASQAKIFRLGTEKAAAEQASAEIPAKIAGYEKQLDAVRATNNELVIKMSRTEADLKTVAAARDEAVAQVARMKQASKEVDKLLTDNATLMAKLGEAEKSLLQFKADGTKRDEEMAALRKETTSLQSQLTKAQQESVDYQKQMADLQQRLSAANTQIAETKGGDSKDAAERARMLEENNVLRGIVLRGQKEEARRSQTKKLVLGELDKVEKKSKTLMDQIDYLSSPVVKLSEKERGLFKKPELQISDTEISLSAPRPGTGPTVTTEPPLPSADPLPPAATPAPVAAAKPAGAAPGLSLSIGVPAPGRGNGAFSALPDGIAAPKTPDMTLAKATTPAPQNLTKPAATPEPEVTPSKPVDPKAPVENPLASPPGGTANVSSAAMNLPADLATLAREGKDLFDKEKYPEAERIYEKVLAKAPNNLYTLSNLGVVYFRSNKLKRAEEMFKKAIAIAPEDGFSHCTLGIVYYSQQKYDEAVNELTKALAINPKNATAHNYLGITASQKGWQEAAQKELETAVALDPGYADAHFNLAVVYATQQPPNKENARKCYKRATELGAEPDPALESMIK